MSTQSIRSIQITLSDLADAQLDVVRALGSAMENVQSDKKSAQRALQGHVQSLVLTDNADRYAALTKAAQASDIQQNFTALVQDWTQQDAVNREERAKLEKDWGTHAQVLIKAKDIKEGQYGIDETEAALEKVSPAVETFDQTTQKIKEHNGKYPKAQITEENHDSFEKWNFLRWAGWITFISRGPHKAYRVISEYTKVYGDYYEDVRQIVEMRENEKKLQQTLAAKKEEYNGLLGIAGRMETLDGAYRGPEGIASGIRSLVSGAVLKSTSFAEALIENIGGADAVGAALSAAKLRRYKDLETILTSAISEAKATQNALQDAADNLGQAVSRVGGEHVYFDAGIEADISRVARISRAIVRDVTTASNTMDEYCAPAGSRLAGMEAALLQFTGLKTESNHLRLDFGNLKSNVDSKVTVYEAEQERLRIIAEAARQKRLAEQREREAEQEKQQQQITKAFNHITRTIPNLGGGSKGVTQRNSGNLGMGKSGVKGRH